MIETLRLCPQCCKGHMKSISRVAQQNGNIDLYECDNENCKYKNAETAQK
jgi:hypothetical protein